MKSKCNNKFNINKSSYNNNKDNCSNNRDNYNNNKWKWCNNTCNKCKLWCSKCFGFNKKKAYKAHLLVDWCPLWTYTCWFCRKKKSIWDFIEVSKNKIYANFGHTTIFLNKFLVLLAFYAMKEISEMRSFPFILGFPFIFLINSGYWSYRLLFWPCLP